MQQHLSNLTTKRIFAVLIDVIPILIVTFFMFYYFLDLDNDLINLLRNPEQQEFQSNFNIQLICIHIMSFFMWITYGMLMDCSKAQGTFGKVVMEIKVTTPDGNRIDCKRAVTRNLAKFASALPLFLGFIWTLLNKEKRSWHDNLTDTKLIKQDDIKR